MIAVKSWLKQALGKASTILTEFITILALGLLVAFLAALPWLLRFIAVLAWLIGGYFAIQFIKDVYGPNSPAGPLLALQFAVIFLMTAWVGGLLRKSPTFLWGGLLLGGLFAIWLTRLVLPALLKGWQHADLFFRILPPALFATTLFYMTLRLRRMRSIRN